jgi:ABC-type phosphate transport system permease subunit
MEETGSAIGGIAVMIFVLLYLGIIVLVIASWWKIFEKAGKPGWAAIVPIYSAIVMLEIIGKPAWWLLMFFIPVVNIVFAIWMTNLLSKSFGKEEGYTVGLVLLGVIFLPMLAFGDSQYVGPAGNPDFQFARNTYAPGVSSNQDIYNSNN